MFNTTNQIAALAFLTDVPDGVLLALMIIGFIAVCGGIVHLLYWRSIKLDRKCPYRAKSAISTTMALPERIAQRRAESTSKSESNSAPTPATDMDASPSDKAGTDVLNVVNTIKRDTDAIANQVAWLTKKFPDSITHQLQWVDLSIQHLQGLSSNVATEVAGGLEPKFEHAEHILRRIESFVSGAVQDNLNRLKQEKADLEKRLEQQKADYERQLQEVENIITGLDAAIAQRDQDLAEKKQELAAAYTANSDLQGKLDSAETNLTAFQAALEATNTSIAARAAQIATLEAKLSSMDILIPADVFRRDVFDSLIVQANDAPAVKLLLASLIALRAKMETPNPAPADIEETLYAIASCLPVVAGDKNTATVFCDEVKKLCNGAYYILPVWPGYKIHPATMSTASGVTTVSAVRSWIVYKQGRDQPIRKAIVS